MPTNTGRKPFTELFETTQQELVREAASGVEGKYKGLVNQIYLNDLIAVLPETYIRKKGFITTVADYTTGTVTIGTGTSNVMGSSTAWTAGNSDDLNLRVTGYNKIYRMTFAAGTSLTFQNSLTWTESSGTGNTYKIFQNRYTLASDFSYIVADDAEEPTAVSYMLNGNEIFVPPMDNDEYDKTYNDSINTTFAAYTIRHASDGFTKYLELWPNPDVVDIIGYWYIPIITSMSEMTTGTATFTTGTALLGASTLFANLTTADGYIFVRNDADGTGSSSLWFRVSSIANNTAATLANAFTGTSGTGIAYSMAQVSKWPARFDDAILYKTALVVDPDNVQVPKWEKLYQEAIGLDKATEAKRRKTSQVKHFTGLRKY